MHLLKGDLVLQEFCIYDDLFYLMKASFVGGVSSTIDLLVAQGKEGSIRGSRIERGKKNLSLAAFLVTNW